MLDTAAQSEKPLKSPRDVSFNLLRGHSGIECGNHHDRNIDLREKVYRHPHEHGRPDHGNHQANNNNEIRKLDRKLRHELLSSSCWVVARAERLLDGPPGLASTGLVPPAQPAHRDLSRKAPQRGSHLLLPALVSVLQSCCLQLPPAP